MDMIVLQIHIASPNEDELFAMANALSGGNVYSAIERGNNRNKSSVDSVFKTLKPAIRAVLESGIKIIIVTLGSDGVLLCSKGGPSFMRISHEETKQSASNGQLYEAVAKACPSRWLSSSVKSKRSSRLFAVHFPALPASVVRVTGAGDCLVGGTLASICAGLDIMQSLAVGIAAAKATIEAETNVPCAFDLDAITGMRFKLYFSSKRGLESLHD